MILAATWNDGSFIKPGKIRNMSSLGAMVECSFPPSVGACIILNRGKLRAPASVVWAKADGFGIKFDTPVQVREWLADDSGTGVTDGSLNRSSVHSYVASPVNHQTEHKLPESVAPEVLIDRLCEEIAYSARAVSNMANLLANDAMLRHRYAVSLQELTLSSQSLTEIAAILRDSDKMAAIQRIATGSMRQRILRKGSL